MADRAGKELERIVTHLETIKATEKGMVVESPKLIRDKTSGQMREHDVVITYPSHHGVKVSLECKDWKRPVDSPAVEAFAIKCRDTDIQKGTMVSAAGFAEPAKAKAAAHGIGCFSLKEAIEFGWLAIDSMTMATRKLLAITFGMLPEDPETVNPKVQADVLAYDEDNKLVEFETLRDIIWSNFGNRVPYDYSAPGEPIEKTITLGCEGWSVSLDGKKPVPLKAIRCDVTYVVDTKEVPLSLLRYEDTQNGGTVSEAAIANLESEHFSGRLSLVTDSDGKTGIYLSNVETSSKE